MISVFRHTKCKGIVFFYEGPVDLSKGPVLRSEKAIYPDGVRPQPATRLRDCEHCGERLDFGSQHLYVEPAA